jgi:ribosome maturation factor RimP
MGHVPIFCKLKTGAPVARTGQLQQLLEPAVKAVGFELWGLDYHASGRKSLLRVYIDSPDGITVDDCAQVSRQVSGVLEVEDPIQGEYTLEVSSPGLDRPLYTLEHYRLYGGHRAQLRLRLPFDGKRKLTGLLGGVENNDVLLVVGDEEYVLPFDSIERGQLADK